MTVTLTQDNVLGRIRVDATGLAAADYATIERSVDQITWTACRGASAWPVTAGAFSNPFDDYEFPDGVLVYYRVRGHESAAITFVAAGTAATGNNASVTPTLPAGLVDHDLMILYASIRNTSGSVNTPTGWTLLRTYGNTAWFGRYRVAGDANPVVSFTGGVVNADTLARIEAWRSAGIEVVTAVDQTNGSAQDIAYPALTIADDALLILEGLWKQDDFSATPTARTGFTSGGNWISTAGDDAGMALYYQIQATATNLPSGTHTVTGGAAAVSKTTTLAFAHAEFLNEQTRTITPALTGTWIKSLSRPFLNRIVKVLDYSDVVRKSRNVAFDVIGRSLPVGVADVMGGRAWTMTVWTETLDDADDLDTVLASGDIWFVHVPVSCTVPGGYVIIDGDVSKRRTRPKAVRRHFDLPFLEVAAPSADVAGATSTWATVLARYATWADLIADKATWADVLELIGSANEVIVA
jgi:hypothetical protein